MNMQMKHAFDYKGSVITATEYFGASESVDAAIYFHDSDETGQYLADAAERLKMPVVLIGIEGEDWNRDLSPWPAPKVFRNEDDFAGGADAYLGFLCKTVIPQLERDRPIIKRRMLMGYSLAGLFAVYSLYRTDAFQAAASVSGSLWYDDFIDFADANTPLKIPRAIYFSLGDKECKTRNPRMARVEQCTEKIERIMAANGAETLFERNPGNHFVDAEKRMEKALTWLFEKIDR